MRPVQLVLAASLASLCSSSTVALAQTFHFGVEPNNSKATATPALDVRAGDWLALPLSGSSVNYFRVRHAPEPLGPHRYELRPSFMLLGNTLSILGRNAATDVVDPSSNAALSLVSDTPALTSYLAWYGFGKSEELYVDLSIWTTSRMHGLIGADFVVSPAPEHDLGAVAEQSLVLAARALSGAPDLELHVFDAEWNALPYGANDDALGGSSAPRVVFDAPPGVYHIAVADREAASHLPPDARDLRAQSVVLDFAGAFACSAPGSMFDVELTVESAAGGPPLVSRSAQKFLAYEALWFRLQVGSGQTFGSHCHGDGSAGACGCLGAAPLQSAMGCVNSTGRGATAIASGLHLPGGAWRVTLEDLPPLTLALMFVSLQALPPAAAFGGLSCIGPAAVRVGPLQADAAGTAFAPAYDPAASGFLAGQTLFLQGAYRDALAPSGCQVNFTSGFWFVAR